MNFFENFRYFARYLTWDASGECDEIGCYSAIFVSTDLVTRDGERFRFSHCYNHEISGAFDKTIHQLLEDSRLEND